MRSDLYWIDGPWLGRLAISSRPRGGDWLEDEIRSWQRAGLDVVVSLLTSDEIADLDLTREAKLCQDHGLQFISFPIVDRSVPSSRRTAIDLVRKLEETLTAGKRVVIHCRQGIGRAALIAAALIMLSNNAVNKRGYCQKEIRLALETLQEIPDDQVYIIPARIEECEIPESLSSYNYVDLFENWRRGLKKILDSLKASKSKSMSTRISR